MATGTECLIGKKMVAQRPLNEWYLNEGVAWVDEAAVLAGIPSGSRSDGMFVKIGLVLYWFKADLTTLEVVPFTAAQTAALTSLLDTAALYDADNVEDALAEVKAQANATDAAITALGTIGQSVYTIDLTTASDSVAARVAGATETTDYPTGWVLAANATVNLLITHTLTGRKLAGCNIFEIDGSDERLLEYFSSAFSGILCNGLTVLIEGLAPVDLALRIELIFS
jgi:hypothetical protein